MPSDCSCPGPSRGGCSVVHLDRWSAVGQVGAAIRVVGRLARHDRGRRRRRDVQQRGRRSPTAVEPLAGVDWVRVIVVDNASGDDTVDVLRTLPVETIALEENGGFAHGCNVGWRAGSAPYVLFLNPDARIEPDGAGERSSRSSIGTSASARSRRGSRSPTARSTTRSAASRASARASRRRSSCTASFPTAAWVDEVIRDPAAYEHPHPSSGSRAPASPCAGRVLEEIGGLDESFFHYSEDIDICARIWERGLRGAVTCRRRSPSTRAARRRRARGCCRSSPRAGSATRRSTTGRRSALLVPRERRARGR